MFTLSCGRTKTKTFENGVGPVLQGRAFQGSGQMFHHSRCYATVYFKLSDLFAIEFSALKSSTTICSSTNAFLTMVLDKTRVLATAKNSALNALFPIMHLKIAISQLGLTKTIIKSTLRSLQIPY